MGLEHSKESWKIPEVCRTFRNILEECRRV
ncbi:hypothetical protein KSS87_017760 [Heliosperma pusillum]|nr:hypothetical protein KSS87_017760 [Heliosperma pusillum]